MSRQNHVLCLHHPSQSGEGLEQAKTTAAIPISNTCLSVGSSGSRYQAWYEARNAVPVLEMDDRTELSPERLDAGLDMF